MKTPGQASPSATYKSPELRSAAETVMLPKFRPAGAQRRAGPDRGAGTERQGGTEWGHGIERPSGGGRRARADQPLFAADVIPAAEADADPRPGADELVTILPTRPVTVQPRPAQTMPFPMVHPARSEQGYTPSRRRTWVSRAVLLGILAMQAIFSLRLHNTAYLDEANYAFGGRMEIAHLFHGVPLPTDFASVYSGSPVLYPVLSAALNSIGGLLAARLFSLFEMLATTALLYAITRRLFNERAGLCAALLFSAAESTIFLGNFATFDASCVLLLALASWIMVRTSLSRWPLFLLAAPLAALAVATKYAGLLWVPTVAVLPALTAWPYHRRRAFAYPIVFGLAVAALLFGAVRWAGPAYLHAVETTTTARAHGDTPLHTLLWQAVQWGGLVFGAAVLGSVAYVWRPRTEPAEQIAPAGSRLRRAIMGLVLTGTALLAPAYQAHLRTNESFQKHIGFGLFFAAPMAGVGLARIVGDHFRRPQLAVAVWGFAILLGVTQSAQLFASWGNSRQFISALTRQLKPGSRYLIEDAQVPEYYLGGRRGAQPSQFHDTFSIVYNDHGQILTGDLGFETAIEQGFFNVVAYNNAETANLDVLLARELEADPSYRLAAVVPDTTADVHGAYYIWVKKTPASAGTKSARRR
jgi:4-amino-4-deoxy-L-arabinose transferase-like glycosyltransferase